MEFIASYWFVWLFTLIVSVSGFIFLQWSSVRTWDMPPIALFGFLVMLANSSLVLLLIAVVIHIINYYSQLGV